MPLEIKELIIKATVAVDWANQTITTAKEDVCIKLPSNKEIVSYVTRYFKENKIKHKTFNRAELSAFLIKWKASLNSPA